MDEKHKQEIKNRIMGVITRRIDVGIIKTDNHVKFDETLQIDSLSVIEIVMLLEDAFNIEISDKDINGIKTLNKLIQLIEAKIDHKKLYY